MKVVRWGLAGAGALLGSTLLLHLVLAILDPLVPLLLVLIFILTIFAIALIGR